MTEGTRPGRAVVERALVAIDDLRAKLAAAERAASEPVAVVGIGCRFPGGANDPASFWRLLLDGVDAVRDAPPDRWPDADSLGADASSVREAGFLDAIDRFDPEFFGIAPREAVHMDPQHRLFLEVAWEALENAGVAPAALAGTQTGVFLGITLSEYLQLETQVVDRSRVDAYLVPGSAPNVAAGRLSHALGLHGPSIAVDTACSSSLVAVHLACQSLRTRDSDVALAGGVNALVVPETFIAFSKLGLTAPDGRCKAFSAAADGMGRAEGCGVVVLKRLPDAVASGDTVLAVIRGSAVNQDGPSSGLSVPNGLAQQAVVKAALARAGVRPEEIGYVEAHGTGTTLGDPIEAEALGAVLGPGTPGGDPVLLGSVKSNLGHLESASGVAGLIKLVLALRHGQVPPHLHFEEPSPRIPWSELPFAVPTRTTRWKPRGGRRVGGVSSFGYSGTNAHVVVEEAPPPEPAAAGPEPRWHLLPLSAKREEALAELAGRYARYLEEHPDASLADVCHTAATGRSHFPVRLALVAATAGEARERLAAVAASAEAPSVLRGRAAVARRPRVAFACPAEGDPGALRADLAATHPAFRRGLERVERAIRAGLRVDPDAPLPQDAAVLAVELALAELWRSLGVEPAAVAGDGVGGVAARCIAGALGVESAGRILAARAAGLPEPETESSPARIELLTGAGPETLRARGYDAIVPLDPGAGGPRALLELAGRLYVDGFEIDWAALDPDAGRRRLELPTYPFRRERYWIDDPRRRPGRREAGAGGKGHPLLGSRLRSPVLEATVFVCDLGGPEAAFLRDHRVCGRAVLPATAYLELALAAASELEGEGPAALEGVTIHEPLTLPDSDEAPETQLVLAGDGGFRLFSLAPGGEWRLHGAGRTRRLDAAEAPLDGSSLEVARTACRDEQPVERLAEELAARGLEFGPAFGGIERLLVGEGQALAEVRRPDGVRADGFRFHPGLLDAALRALAAAWPDELRRGTGTYLPVAVDRVVLHRPPGERLAAHARLRPGARAGAETLEGDVLIYDEEGEPVCSVEGLLVKRTQTEPGDGDEPWREWLYEVEWRPAPRPRARPRPALRDIVAAAEAAPADRDDGGPAVELDALATAYARRALEELGRSPDGDGHTSGSGVEELGVVDRQQRLFARLRAGLADEGSAPTTGADPDALLAELRERHPGYVAELTLLGRCGPRLADVLRGACDPLELLFPGGSVSALEGLYRDSPTSRRPNALVAEAVRAAVAALPETETVRILEIGGGVGGTTAHVLPLLPAGRTEYVFTDVSPAFTAGARERFRDFPFVRSAVFDVEQDPSAQGLEGRFDLVLAANVLHATRDLREALGHVRDLLAPGGLALLAEVVRPRRWIDLTFGLTEGWWRFADAALRDDYPLLDEAGWAAVLEGSGFGPVASISAGDPDGSPAPQAVLLAARPSAERGAWLVVSDERGTGSSLAASLEERGERVVRSRVGDDLGRAVADATAAGPLAGVLHLAALDADLPPDAGLRELDAAVEAGCGSALRLVQALARAPEPARLVLVTRGARAVAPEDAAAPAQASLWGLGKVVSLEHPELRCLRVDLDPGRVGNGAELEALLAEVLAGGEEDEVAFRRGERYVPRLVASAARSWTPAADEPVRLEIGTPGLLDTLALRPARRRAPGPGEVEVRVRASGLNFRDVLAAMGMYPGDAGPLGGECAGEVVAVGPGVEGLEIGDAVAALAVGSLATYVTVRAELAVRKPEGLTFEEAATVLAAYLTAHEALVRLGRIAPGERVLVHAAAGGVGVAAVRIAQRAGAEIFATAGTPEKRAFVESLGVRHVMSSRTLDFEQEVLERTGGRGVDVVLNSLAGEFIPASLATLAESGRFLELGKRGVWTEAEVASLRPNAAYEVIDLAAKTQREPAAVGTTLRELMSAVEDGALPPLPHADIPLVSAEEAFRTMAQAKHVGKLVLLQAARTPVRTDGAYLVTGGLAGLGLLAAQRLVELGARHLVLAGRHDPSEHAREAIAALEGAGASVLPVRCDVSRPDEVAALLERCDRSQPPLRGVVHCAGVLDDGALLTQEWSRFETVFAPKVGGAFLLDRATRDRPLDFFVLFSSASAVLGSPGQANHAAANAFLDALAHDRRSRGLPGLSLGWGRWAEVGAASGSALDRRMSEKGIGAIRPEEGLDAFEHALRLAVSAPSASAQLLIVPADWHAFTRKNGGSRLLAGLAAPASAREEPDGRTAAAAVPPGSPDLVARLAAAPAARWRALIEEHVRERALRVLGLDPGRSLDPSQPLNELGLDSLMAVELRNVLGADLALERPLPATLVFDYPTVEALVDYLVAGRPGGGRAAAPAPNGEPAARSDIADLSEAEAEALLVEELAAPEGRD